MKLRISVYPASTQDARRAHDRFRQFRVHRAVLGRFLFGTPNEWSLGFLSRELTRRMCSERVDRRMNEEAADLELQQRGSEGAYMKYHMRSSLIQTWPTTTSRHQENGAY